MTLSAKMTTTVRKMYCASQYDHRCARRDLSVSAGDNEVLREAMEDVGDCRLLIFDLVALHFRRSLCGRRAGIDDRLGMRAFADMRVGELEGSRKERYLVAITVCVRLQFSPVVGGDQRAILEQRVHTSMRHSAKGRIRRMLAVRCSA